MRPGVREAFLEAAGGKLTVTNATTSSMTSVTPGMLRLHLTGFHQDGTPFVVETAPFEGDPAERARQVAQDILTTHTGVPHMGAPAAIKGLAATLREQLTAATTRAAALGETAKTEVANLHKVLDEGEGVVKEVKDAAAEVQAALGLSTNGGPVGPLSG